MEECEKQVRDLAKGHVIFAIQMWMKSLIELCDENSFDSHTYDYSVFITNCTRESQINQAIHDFYDYFYTNQHICDVNSMATLGEIDNKYGTTRYSNNHPANSVVCHNVTLRLLDTLKNIENNAQSKSVFQTMTIYVFQLCLSVRKELGLPRFEDTEKDASIAKYFTRY